MVLLSRLLRYLLVGSAFFFLTLYTVLAIIRIQYPFELEWMEGCSLLHVQRILAGYKLYVQPSLSFTPFIYNPLYFYVAAAVSSLLGADFFSLRLVSLLSSVGCFWLIYSIVANESDRWVGIIAAGLFAATFRLSGAWFDIARVDSLFLFMFLGAVFIIRRWRSEKATVIAAILVSLSFLTKQTALVLLVPLGIYFCFGARKKFLYFTATVVFLIGGCILIFDRIHEGWYTYYAFYLPQNFPSDEFQFLDFILNDILWPFPLASLIAIVFLIQKFRTGNRDQLVFYSLFLLGMLAASWLSRGRIQGYDNALIPAYAAICILFGLGLHTLLDLIPQIFPRHHYRIAALLYAVCIAQFALMKYDPLAQLPADADLRAGKELIGMVAQFDGDVFIPNHPYLAVMAGKTPHALSICLRDVWRGDTGSIPSTLLSELKSAIEQRQFGAIILDGPEFSLLPLFEFQFEEFYQHRQGFEEDSQIFVPVTGWPAKPLNIYMPRH